MGRPNQSRETKFSGANGHREKIVFSVQLITSRIGNLTRLIRTLLYIYVIIIHTCTYYPHFILYATNSSGRGKREVHINWSMVTCKMAAPVVTGTTLRTTGPVPAESRQ